MFFILELNSNLTYKDHLKKSTLVTPAKESQSDPVKAGDGRLPGDQRRGRDQWHRQHHLKHQFKWSAVKGGSSTTSQLHSFLSDSTPFVSF